MAFNEAGIFDLANPLFAGLESTLLDSVPALARLVIWALAASILSMGLYRLLSPQGKIKKTGERATELRKKLAVYDDEFDGLPPLAMALLWASGRHFFLILGPAIAASIPILFLLSWIDQSYGDRLPAPGDIIAVEIAPATAVTTWSSSNGVERLSSHAWQVRWPTGQEPLSLRESNGATALKLPLAHAVDILHKKLWWNYLFANPNGYLPDTSSLDYVSIDLPTRGFLEIGPDWARGWEATFFCVLILASLAIKFLFRVH